MLEKKVVILEQVIFWMGIGFSVLIFFLFVMIARASRRFEQTSDKITELSLRDTMTNLFNQNGVIEHLPFLLATDKRHDQTTSIALIDLDQFKTINQKYGFTAGDQVIKNVANQLIKRLREQDLIARWEGDSFLLILPETPGDRAIAIMNEIKELIEQFPYQINEDNRQGSDNVFHVTASIGLTTLTSLQQDFSHALWEADSAVVNAKESGRNQLRLFDPSLV